VQPGGPVALKKLLISSDGATPMTAGLNVNGPTTIEHVSVIGINGGGMLAAHQLTVNPGGTGSTSCNTGDGLKLQTGGRFFNGGTWFVSASNGSCGINVLSGLMESRSGGTLASGANAAVGLNLSVGSVAEITSNGIFSSNGNVGVYAFYCKARILAATISQNGAGGLFAQGSQMSIDNSTFSANAANDIGAIEGAFVKATGSTGVSSPTPALNTIGNNNSLILY
jgi:hypothetical protein